MSNFWDDATGVLTKVAPLLASAVGGPLAGAATSAIISALGLAPGTTQEQAALAVVGATPDQLIALKKADQDFAVKMAQLDQDKLATLVASDGQQVAVNTAEASNASVFVAGWRPAVGWACAAGVAWAFVVGPLAGWATGRPVGAVDVANLLVLLQAMLGLAGLRSWEKVKGINAGH